MESTKDVLQKKPKLRQSLNLRVAECIRQFELPQQFPSTVTELYSSKSVSEIKTTTAQTKSVQNIISSLPLTGKMKFIPNKEVSISENLQKVKLKLPDGRDLGEVKIVLPGQEDKLQAKVLTMSKIGQTSEKPVTLRVKSNSGKTNGKPMIKNITRILNHSASPEKHKNEANELNSVKVIKQIVNVNQNSPRNMIQTNKPVMTNVKKMIAVDGPESDRQKFVVHNTNGNVIKKFIIGNKNIICEKQNQSQIFTLKKLSEGQKVVMIEKDSGKALTFKTKTQNFSDDQSVQINKEKIIFKNLPNGSVLKKRDNSHIKEQSPSENKKLRFENDFENVKIIEDASSDLLNRDQNKNSEVQKKNVEVIVPSKTIEELVTSNLSNNSNSEVLQINEDDAIVIQDNEAVIEEIQVDNVQPSISKSNKEKEQTVNVIESNNKSNTLEKTYGKPQDLNDKFSILEKALLSVQDATLRAEALKALKDCGMKVKKTVSIKRPVPTKIINESATQTHVFSLLKEDEFVEVTEEVEDLVKIKKSRKMMKQPINTLSNTMTKPNHKMLSEKDQMEFKNNLDKCLDKVFPQNQGITMVKEAFVQSNITKAKIILKQLQADYEAAKNYDDDGFLGIHKAVLDDNIREVQKHMLMLKATKQSIDVCSQDNKSSLELAVEYDVNPQIVKVLLDAGAQPVSSKKIHDSAIITAAKTSSKILPLLCNYVARNKRSLLNNTNAEGLAAIHYCAQRGNLEGIKELLKHGADVNLQEEKSGRTPLFYVIEIQNGDAPQEVYNEIAFKLLEHGAYSDITTFSKHSVLSMIDEVKSHTLKLALNKAVK